MKKTLNKISAHDGAEISLCVRTDLRYEVTRKLGKRLEIKETSCESDARRYFERFVNISKGA